MSDILVTGAAGFIGSNVAARLISAGHRVVTIDNLSTGFEANVPPGVEFIKGDAADPEIIDRLAERNLDAVFHIAGQSSGEVSFDDPVSDVRSNAVSTLLLLELCKKIGCARFIFASTMSVYGRQGDAAVEEECRCSPASFYGVAKLASENYLRIYEQFGIRSTALRLFNVYGPGQNLDNLRQGMVSIFLAQMLESGHIRIKGSPERFRDFIYVEDVVEAFVRCLDNDAANGEIINVATGVPTRVSELVLFLTTAYSESVSVEYRGSTPGDVHGIFASVSKMDQILGNWEKVDINSGIESMVNRYSVQRHTTQDGTF